MSFDIGFRKKTLHHLAESRAKHREKDARNADVVTWLSQTRCLTTAVYSQGSRYVSNWNLITLK